jgi:two-component system phosphate regulon sensor histidine kinase PhoR
MRKNIFLSILKIVCFAAGIILLAALIWIGPGDAMLRLSMIVLVTVLVCILLARRAASKVSKPVEETVRLLSRFADERVPEQRIEEDEAQRLALGVNSLAGMLDKITLELNHSNSSLKAILKSIPCAVVAVDRDKKIVMFNDMARDFFAIPKDAEGKYFIERVRYVSMEKMIDRALSTKKNVEEERPIVSLDDESIYKINAAPIKIQNKVSGAVLLAQDITDIRHLEMMRRDFAANVSHELKTPLTVINGFIETIKTEQQLDKKTRDKFLDIISMETDRLSRLIEDILTLSEIETGVLSHVENVNVDECIGKSVELLRKKAEKKDITLEKNLLCPKVTVQGNGDRVTQMAINLIDNAIKYTPEGGRVTVSTSKSGENCMIIVEDNGIGISMEDQRRLFERFYRADKSRSRELGGTGLGLSIVKHIVSSMNGRVLVKSAPGRGSVFTVIFPID